MQRNAHGTVLLFFFNDTATTEIYTLSLHDAPPISSECRPIAALERFRFCPDRNHHRSEEHTSELQSPCNLVCRLLLEKKINMPPVNLQRLRVVQTQNLLLYAYLSCSASGTGTLDDPQLTADLHFFFNDTATTEIYTLSLHDALPI